MRVKPSCAIDEKYLFFIFSFFKEIFLKLKKIQPISPHTWKVEDKLCMHHLFENIETLLFKNILKKK